MTSFAYVQARPNTLTVDGIFYVGKGNSLRRSKNFNARNKYYGSVVEKYGTKDLMVGVIPCSTEEIAFDLEKGLIKCLRRMGVKLTNMSDGGEGSSGVPASNKQRQAVREMNLKRSIEERKLARSKEPSDTNSKRSSSTAKRHALMSQDQKQDISDKLTKANLSSWADPEIRARRIAGMKGAKKTMSEKAILQRRNAASKIVKGI